MDERVSGRGQIRSSYCVQHGRRKAEVTRLNKAKLVFSAKTGAIPTFMKALFLDTLYHCSNQDKQTKTKESPPLELYFFVPKKGGNANLSSLPCFPPLPASEMSKLRDRPFSLQRTPNPTSHDSA